jgi:hypothetical protein
LNDTYEQTYEMIASESPLVLQEKSVIKAIKASWLDPQEQVLESIRFKIQPFCEDYKVITRAL